jgi:hypothetical protein
VDRSSSLPVGWAFATSKAGLEGANILKILLRLSSAINEKSLAEIENKIWLGLKIKHGAKGLVLP